MGYTIDKVEQLQEAIKRSRFGSVASLRAAGVTAKQHKGGGKQKHPHQEGPGKSVTKKTTAKKTSAKKAPAKKAAAKKTTAKKTAKKPTAKKS